MSVLLTESIVYNVNGAKGVLDNLRTFASSLGWTVDYYKENADWDTVAPYTGWISGDESHLQIWSNGWALQNMTFRFSVTDSPISASADQLNIKAVFPGVRTPTFDGIDTSIVTDPINQNTLGAGGGTSYEFYKSLLPSSTFDTMWMFGNKYFISLVMKMHNNAVITICMGSLELFRSWWYEEDGLFFIHNPCDDHLGYWNTTKLWSTMNENPTAWYGPLQLMNTSTWTGSYFKGGNRSHGSAYYEASNFSGTSQWTTETAPSGSMNRLQYLLNYNSYTDKRVAVNPTAFVRDPNTDLWHVMGRYPFAVMNGRNLTMGETITFGTDTYRVFPWVFSEYELWQGYLISQA